ncbi:hypothetical protein NL676_037609 [Syzygium grande]|nr:hypothetical protein NL676_037609 [Syzygium grande]
MNKKDEVFHPYRLHCFCYNVLKDATNKFSGTNFIGEGGFGDVYKGWISYRTMNAAKPHNGQAIAVKKLRDKGPQGQDEWLHFDAKISDFGLAKFGPQGDQSHVSSRVLGTRGYFAPEYIATGHLTLKTDVYSFGVVLLEIFSGSRAIRKHSNGTTGNLAQWAEPYLKDKVKLHRVMDRKLKRNVPAQEAHEFAEIILMCLHLDPTSRPTMAEVAARLEEIRSASKLATITSQTPASLRT